MLVTYRNIIALVIFTYHSAIRTILLWHFDFWSHPKSKHAYSGTN